MALTEETYDLVDEYLQSAIEVMEKMYQEHGEKIFTLLKDADYFEKFKDETYELTETISDKDLEHFSNFYMRKLSEAFHGEITPIAIAKKDLDGRLEYDLKILDTTIKFHKRGRNIEWGSNTPTKIKTIINNVVMGS